MRMQCLCVLLLTSLLVIGCTQPNEVTPTPDTPTIEPQKYVDARQRLADHAILIQSLTDEAVIHALRTVPRHRFVTPEYVDKAYDDNALPIGYGQTISQPSLVALRGCLYN